MTTPWKDLPKKARDAVLYGTGEEEITITYDDGIRAYKTKKPFEGVIGNIERRWRETDSDWMREELSKYQSDHPCSECNGYPPEAAGAGGEDRPQAHRRNLGHVDPRGQPVVRRRCWRS